MDIYSTYISKVETIEERRAAVAPREAQRRRRRQDEHAARPYERNKLQVRSHGEQSSGLHWSSPDRLDHRRESAGSKAQVQSQCARHHDYPSQTGVVSTYIHTHNSTLPHNTPSILGNHIINKTEKKNELEILLPCCDSANLRVPSPARKGESQRQKKNTTKTQQLDSTTTPRLDHPDKPLSLSPGLGDTQLGLGGPLGLYHPSSLVQTALIAQKRAYGGTPSPYQEPKSSRCLLRYPPDLSYPGES